MNFRAKNDTSFVGTEFYFTILQTETFLSYFSNSNTAIRYWKWHFANSASLSIFFSRLFSLPNQCIFPLHFYLENFRWRVSVYLRYLTKMIKRSFTSSGQSWWVCLLLIVSSHVLKALKKNSLLLPLKISCYENALTVNHKTDKKLMWLSQLKNAVFSVERENAKKPPKM